MWGKFKELNPKVKWVIAIVVVGLAVLSVMYGSPSPDVVSS